MRQTACLALLILTCAGLAACGGGTSQWDYDWVSANGNVSIDASGENDKFNPFDAYADSTGIGDAYYYKQGDPQFSAPW